MYDFSDTAGHVARQRGFYSPFSGRLPRHGWYGGLRKSVSDLKEEPITEKCPVRHVLGIRQPLANGDLDSVYWLSGPEDPAEGATTVKSDVIPAPQLPKSPTGAT